MKAIRCFLIMAVSSILICSCNREKDVEPSDNGKTAESETVEDSQNDLIHEYYLACEEFISKLLYGSQNGEVYGISLPEIGILNDLDIELANGDKIKFSDLSLNDQSIFIHEALKYMSLLQSEKAGQINMASFEGKFRQLLETVNFASDLASEYIKGGKSISEIMDAIWAVYCEPSLDNIKYAMDYWVDLLSPTTRGIIGADSNQRTFTWNEFIERVGGVAKKGDLFIVLPIHNEPQTLVNLTGPGLAHHTIGHCAMCVDDFLPTTPEDQRIIMGAIQAGVTIEPSSMWFFEFYILEIQKFKYKWLGNTSRPLVITTSTMSEEERDRFVEFGKQHLGDPFIEFTVRNYLATKTVVPDAFTCAAFIWYCAKSVYGIDLSIPELPTVAPAHIVCSPYIRIKKVVQ